MLSRLGIQEVVDGKLQGCRGVGRHLGPGSCKDGRLAAVCGKHVSCNIGTRREAHCQLTMYYIASYPQKMQRSLCKLLSPVCQSAWS